MTGKQSPDSRSRLRRGIAGVLLGLSAGAFVWEWLAAGATFAFFKEVTDSDKSSGFSDGNAPDLPGSGSLLPVSVIMPLKGGTEANRRSIRAMLAQDHPDFDVTISVHAADTEATALVKSLQAESGGASAGRSTLRLVARENVLGGRPKVGNLHNAMSEIDRPVAAMIDADVVAGPDFLRQFTAPLSNPEIGLTTCLYRASAGGSLWSRLDALWTSTTYLPSALFGRRVIGDAFAFGAAIAMRRETLEKIGGFAAIAFQVGDDYLLASRTAALGLKVVFVPYVVTEQVESIGFGELISRRSRWSRTIRTHQMAGYTGSLLTYGVPLALLGALVSGQKRSTLWAAAAMANRMLCAAMNRRWFEPDAPVWEIALVPLRDCIALYVWVLGFQKAPVPRRAGTGGGAR